MRGSTEDIFNRIPTGPVKWCRVCGEKHPARQMCNLVPVVRLTRQRTRKSGKMHGGNLVTRLVHPDYVGGIK